MKNVELIGMLDDKKRLETQVSSIIHGSIEVRDKECNKYIYVHYRDNGKLISRYVGEYSDELYNLILNNNIKVKELKWMSVELNKASSQNLLEYAPAISLTFEGMIPGDKVYIDDGIVGRTGNVNAENWDYKRPVYGSYKDAFCSQPNYADKNLSGVINCSTGFSNISSGRSGVLKVADPRKAR